MRLAIHATLCGQCEPKRKRAPRGNPRRAFGSGAFRFDPARLFVTAALEPSSLTHPGVQPGDQRGLRSGFSRSRPQNVSQSPPAPAATRYWLAERGAAATGSRLAGAGAAGALMSAARASAPAPGPVPPAPPAPRHA